MSLPTSAAAPASAGSTAIARHVGLIVVVGLATGALTQIGQSILPDGWSQAANTMAPWLLVAFLLVPRCRIDGGRPSPGSRPCSCRCSATT